jgi:hypothetical protein
MSSMHCLTCFVSSMFAAMSFVFCCITVSHLFAVCGFVANACSIVGVLLTLFLFCLSLYLRYAFLKCFWKLCQVCSSGSASSHSSMALENRPHRSKTKYVSVIVSASAIGCFALSATSLISLMFWKWATIVFVVSKSCLSLFLFSMMSWFVSCPCSL